MERSCHREARGLTAALLAAAALCAPAYAQQAHAPALKAGDRWEFAVYYAVPSREPSRVWTIASVTSMSIEGKENGERLVLTPELNVLDSPRASESNPKSLSFPLEVGKRWRYVTEWLFKAKGSKGRSEVDVEVVALEKVRVPGGEFEAFKLVSKGRLSGTSPINSQYAGETTSTYWYAPAARAVVRSVSHNPYLGMSTVELVSYRPAP
jgi:hypothetical protein